METCDLCRQPTVCGHLLTLDNGRRNWRLCCLCTATLIGTLNHAEEAAPA